MKRKQYVIYFSIALLTTLLMLFTFNYIDGQSLMVWSVSDYDLLFEGRIRDFYLEKTINTRGAKHDSSGANPIMFIPQMIWDFPIWITHYFNGNYNVATLGCIYWYKLFLFIMTVAIAYIVYKMILQLSDDKNKGILGALLVIGSPEVMISTMYAGQDEIVYLFFIVLALYCAISDKYKQFIFWSTCSITCCPFMLIPFLIILVCKEKRIWKILLDCTIVMLPTLLWAIVSINAPAKDIANIGLGSYLSEMMDLFTFKNTTGECSVVGIALVFLVFFAFLFDEKRYAVEDVEKKQIIIWYVSISMLLISFFMDNFFYRLLLYIPTTVVLVLGGKEVRTEKLSLFLLMILSYLRMFCGGYGSPQNMNTAYIARSNILLSICDRLGGTGHLQGSYRTLVGKIADNVSILGSMVSSMNAVMVTAVMIILINHCPYIKKKYNIDIPEKVSILGYILCMPIFMIGFFGILLR